MKHADYKIDSNTRTDIFKRILPDCFITSQSKGKEKILAVASEKSGYLCCSEEVFKASIETKEFKDSHYHIFETVWVRKDCFIDVDCIQMNPVASAFKIILSEIGKSGSPYTTIFVSNDKLEELYQNIGKINKDIELKLRLSE